MPPPPLPVVAAASGVEIVSSDVAVPGRFQPEATDSALVPLVNQFSMMQQQMFDQFQQAMGMLVQMFGTMHREQMDVIREELDRLHDALAGAPGVEGRAGQVVRAARPPPPAVTRRGPGSARFRGPHPRARGRRAGTAAADRPRRDTAASAHGAAAGSAAARPRLAGHDRRPGAGRLRPRRRRLDPPADHDHPARARDPLAEDPQAPAGVS